MRTDFRYAHHPEDVKLYDTNELREHFLITDIFDQDEINLTYTMYDRFIAGGAMPKTKDLVLESFDALKSDYFLERRELGIINVGESGTVEVDGEQYVLEHKEALYIGLGAKSVIFQKPKSGQPLFYINSTPAHQAYPHKKIGRQDAEIIELGDEKYANKRILNKLIVNSLVETNQLQMGMTELVEGNVWNTMPAHTHERRMEVYFYFDLEEGQTISHFMGQPEETRHLFMESNQAVISPEWSIHSGCGTSNYTFIWGMAGENLDYSDMDTRKPNELK